MESFLGFMILALLSAPIVLWVRFEWLALRDAATGRPGRGRRAPTRT